MLNNNNIYIYYRHRVISGHHTYLYTSIINTMAQQKTKRPLPSSSVATALRRYRWIPSPAERPRKFPTENLMMGPQSSEGVQLPNISVAEICALW